VLYTVGAGQRDGRRARIVGELDRLKANAAGRRRDENEVALGDLRVLDERAICGTPALISFRA
jgi:hypothetical protein